MTAPTTVYDATLLLANAPVNILWAPLGTALPASSVVGSVFSDIWATTTGWTPFGISDAGATIGGQVTTTDLDAAELFDPVKKVTTARTASVSLGALQVSKSTLLRAHNGGVVTSTGSTTTTLTQIDPPAPGQETRIMIGVESLDNTVRYVLRQAFQSAALSIVQNKGVRSVVNLQFDGEAVSGAQPFSWFLAGAARAA